MKTNKTFAPYNYNNLMTARIGKVTLDTNDNGEVINYRIEFTTIKELCSDPLYARFNLNGYNIHETFNLIAKRYKDGKTINAKGMYVRAVQAVQEYNDKLIQGITIDIKMNKDRYFEGKEFKERQNNHKVRWDQLVAGLPQNRDLKGYVAKLSDKDRELCLMRAADYGLTVPTTEMERKDVYTMRVAAVASEADDIHPFNTYHEVDDSDPVVTFVGRHKQSVKLRQDEDEVILMAMWFAQYGDEFMLKTHTRDGEEITVRDARIYDRDTEEDFCECRDFQYESGYDDYMSECNLDIRNWIEYGYED